MKILSIFLILLATALSGCGKNGNNQAIRNGATNYNCVQGSDGFWYDQVTGRSCSNANGLNNNCVQGTDGFWYDRNTGRSCNPGSVNNGNNNNCYQSSNGAWYDRYTNRPCNNNNVYNNQLNNRCVQDAYGLWYDQVTGLSCNNSVGGYNTGSCICGFTGCTDQLTGLQCIP